MKRFLTDADAVPERYRIAIMIPCRNEEATIARVVRDFRQTLPTATVYVYDNHSGDHTAVRAGDEGAIVRFEARPGKGQVVRRMFADIDADVYVLVDGDDTYDPAIASRLVNALLRHHLDMVVGCRKYAEGSEPYRQGHRFGNRLFTQVVGLIFGQEFSDILSGYRVFSRRFVKSFPARSTGFEIETEIAIHALQMGVPVAEIETAYRARPVGSVSKLSTYRDGFRILVKIVALLKEFKPLALFGGIFLLLAVLSLTLSVPLFITYFQTGLVPRFPTAILATGLMIVAFLSLVCAVVLDGVSRARFEAKRLAYLSLPMVEESSPIDTRILGG